MAGGSPGARAESCPVPALANAINCLLDNGLRLHAKVAVRCAMGCDRLAALVFFQNPLVTRPLDFA